VTLTEDELSEGSMECPCCGETLEFNYDDIETDFSGSDDEEPLDDDSEPGEDQEN
jgi:hypothetical protein